VLYALRLILKTNDAEICILNLATLQRRPTDVSWIGRITPNTLYNLNLGRMPNY